MEFAVARGRGWKPSLPDARDYRPEIDPARRLMSQLPQRERRVGQSCSAVDLREYFPPVQDQQSLHSATAHACLAAYCYFERRAGGMNPCPSRLFLHQVSLRLTEANGNSGLDIRTVLKAMVRFGVPPEGHWPYRPRHFAVEPDAFLYSFSRDFQRIVYVRLDYRQSGQATLHRVRSMLQSGFPCLFGIPLTSWISDSPQIPYMPNLGSVCGGQALVAVGYDDNIRCATRGALLVRNSWGEHWGDGGYGWLPYEYIREGLASDFWILLREDWLNSGEFSRPDFQGGSS